MIPAVMRWLRRLKKKELELWNFKHSGSVPMVDILTGLKCEKEAVALLYNSCYSLFLCKILSFLR